MRVIAHISDLHFGREDSAVVTGLLRSLEECGADAIAVSGDLTQRAKTRQFKQAREFLGRLPGVPYVVVPGNHDVSATNLVERFTKPLAKYRKYITPEMEPFFADEEVAIAGIDTTRVISRKDGRINRSQVACACELLNKAASGAVRVVVTHHPMDLPMEDTKSALVGRSKKAMQAFAGCRVDLFLSGHLHAGVTVSTSERYRIAGYSAIVVHAGTAVSTRTRKEPNSWNLIRVDHEAIAVETMLWDGKRFAQSGVERFRRGADGWKAAG